MQRLEGGRAMELPQEICLTYEQHRLRKGSGLHNDHWRRERFELFQGRFGPDRLSSLDEEYLLETLFDHGSRDSLVYWLEYKGDDEFPTTTFGGIVGAPSSSVSTGAKKTICGSRETLKTSVF